MKNKLILFWIIIVLALSAAFVVWRKPMSLGLDLVGGSRLMLEAQTSDTVKQITGIKKIDDRTVRITLQGLEPDLKKYMDFWILY